MLQVQIYIVRNKKIEESITVVISKCRPRRPTPDPDSCLRRYVGKAAIAVVVVKDINAETGQINIRPSVVIVIPDGTSHAKTRRSKACFLGDVGESAVMIVVIQRSRCRFPTECHR